jgi:hypothetical protein
VLVGILLVGIISYNPLKYVLCAKTLEKVKIIFPGSRDNFTYAGAVSTLIKYRL